MKATVPRHQAQQPQVPVAVEPVGLGELRLFEIVARKRPHHPDAREVFLDHRGKGAFSLLHFPEDMLDAAKIEVAVGDDGEDEGE
jgi:hypothetical protein